MLTRGPIGFLFPAGAIVLFLTLSRGWRRWRELHLLTSGAVFLAIAVPWHVLAEIRSPGFLWAYFVNEHVNRAFGTREPHDYGAVPLWLWWLELLAWLFPWSLFAPLLYREFPRPRTKGTAMDVASQAKLLLFAWAGTILGFFTLESGSRMEYYSFGAWPALALLLGVAIADAEEEDEATVVWVTRALAALGVLFAIGGGAFVWLSSRTPPAADITTHLRTHDADFYRNAMARVLDLTPQALSDLRVPLLVSATSLGGAFLLAWLLRRRGRPVGSTSMLALGMVGLFAASNLAYVALEPSLSSRALAMEINKTLGPDDTIVLYGDIRVAPGVAFYCNRRVLLYAAEGSNLTFGSHYGDAPKTFLSDPEFLALWGAPRRVLLVVPRRTGGRAAVRSRARGIRGRTETSSVRRRSESRT